MKRKPALKDSPIHLRYPRLFVSTAVILSVSLFWSRQIYDVFGPRPVEYDLELRKEKLSLGSNNEE